jgi:hypothetical protein
MTVFKIFKESDNSKQAETDRLDDVFTAFISGAYSFETHYVSVSVCGITQRITSREQLFRLPSIIGRQDDSPPRDD